MRRDVGIGCRRLAEGRSGKEAIFGHLELKD